MTRWCVSLGGLIVVAYTASCTVQDPLYCSPTHACTAGLPYCDVDGLFPSSDHVKNTCIAQPYGMDVEVVGPGSVTSNPVGISCPGDCSEIWDNGTEITLHASPEGGNAFGGWTGDCLGSDPNCVLDATAPHVATARFGAPVHYVVTVQGTGTVVSDPPGINCPGDCDEVFPPYSHVKMTASPAAGSAFAGWDGGCTGANPDCETDAVADATFNARFARELTLTIDLVGDGQGRVTSTDGLIDCSTNCTKVVGEGAVLSLEHVASGESGFDGWAGPCTGEGTCAFTINSSTTVAASFRAPWTKTIAKSAASGVAIAPDGSIYVAGTDSSGSAPRGMLTKLDRGGNAIWTRYAVPSGGTEFYAVAVAANGGEVAVAGGKWATSAPADVDWVVEKWTSGGTNVWSKAYANGAGAFDEAYGVAMDPSGNVIAVGGETPVVGNGMTRLARKLDAATGNLSWAFPGTSGLLLGVASDSVGTIHVAGTDASSTPVKSYYNTLSAAGTPGTPQQVSNVEWYSVALLAGGGFLLAGSDVSSGNSGIVNVMNGASSWTKTFAPQNGEPAAIHGACRDGNGEFRLIGEYSDGVSVARINTLDLDSQGALIWDRPQAGGVSTAAGFVACDPLDHDAVFVGKLDGSWWVRRYYE